MTTYFMVCEVILLVLTLLMLGKAFSGNGFLNRFIGILVMGNNVVLVLLLIGMVDSRSDMYVDIAISYSILGFISSVIVAKFLSRGGGNGAR